MTRELIWQNVGYFNPHRYVATSLWLGDHAVVYMDDDIRILRCLSEPTMLCALIREHGTNRHLLSVTNSRYELERSLQSVFGTERSRDARAQIHRQRHGLTTHTY